MVMVARYYVVFVVLVMATILTLAEPHSSYGSNGQWPAPDGPNDPYYQQRSNNDNQNLYNSNNNNQNNPSYNNAYNNNPPPPHGNNNNPQYPSQYSYPPQYPAQGKYPPEGSSSTPEYGAAVDHDASQQYMQQQQSVDPSTAAYDTDDMPVASDQTVEGYNREYVQNGSNSVGSLPIDESDLTLIDKELIFEGLKKMYKRKVLPLEMASKYGHFASPPMGDCDFEAKPMVLILGQYSVGKTSFIRSLLGRDFPGQRIGPEPTTDRFTAIMHSTEGQESGRHVPGHALVMQPDKPFRALSSYGNNFLSKFEGAEVCAPILRNITIIDTPGVLAGEKQRLGRDYDFSEVIKWFAERADMIIIMFDAHKLDISDELKTVLDTLKPHQDKIRVLLNKADTMDSQSLLRVYGALMWSLGKVVQTPEVCRVYLGSFWDFPPKLEESRALLEREKADLLNEMMGLQKNAVIRRINELVKRARSVKVHAYIIHYLRKQMPYVMGKQEKQARLLDRLDKEFLACARRYNLPHGDFPNVDQYRKMLREIKDISEFKKLDKNLVYEMDKV